MKRITWKAAGTCTAALLACAASCPAAAVLTWTGSGGSLAWGTADNWDARRAPADGDSIAFAAAAGASTLVDLSVRLDTLSFAAGAGAFAVRVADGSSLAFAGLGIQNLTGGTGPIRQALFAAAGSSGGSIVFAGTAGINLGPGSSFRPVDVSALGGAAVGQVGGRVVFQDQASIGSNTYDALRAEGAAAAGAGAGEVAFGGQSVAGAFATLVLVGGGSAGAAGGQGRFADNARVDGIVTLLGGQAAGAAGGRAVFSGTASTGLRSALNNQGGSWGPGAEGGTEFRDAARFSGHAINAAGTSAGANGGRLEFHDRSAFDTSGYDGSLGDLQISNQGATAAGAGGGSVVFHDDSTARGAHAVIVNGVAGEGASPGALGGRTRFADRSNAGALTIYNQGGPGSAGAGTTTFENVSSAGQSRLVQQGGLDNGASGGQVLFRNTANAGNATLVNAAGEIAGAAGGVTTFADASGAGSATITNQTSPSTTGGGRGSTLFRDTSSAQNATIDNQGGTFAINAFTVFSQQSTAGHATLTNFGGRAAGAGGGQTQFVDNASAGTASLVMAGGASSGAEGGQVQFFASATAAGARLDLRGAGTVGAEGGKAWFANNASAGGARIAVQGSQVDNPGGPEGAIVTFLGSASASNATFTVGGNTSFYGAPGRVRFQEASSAADATITALPGDHLGGSVTFGGSAGLTASAGNARITNASHAVAPTGMNRGWGGITSFLLGSTAGRAVIVNEAGATEFGAQTSFSGDATAAQATITNAGGGAGDRGGITFFLDTASAGQAMVANRAGAAQAGGITLFRDSATASQATLTSSGATGPGRDAGATLFDNRSSAGQATLVAEGGSNGGSGGRVVFSSQATGGSARVVLQPGSAGGAGGVLDIGGVEVWVTVGSIEGGGLVNLGARSLIVQGPRATTFSGVISGAAPPVFPSLAVLGGSLTLTGANTYAGRTSIGDGVHANSGKLVAANVAGSATGSGEVRVQRGGTLAGSGFIAGPVTLLDGGVIAPGDPVTLTLHDSLTWDGGGVIRLVLGADTAGSDQLHLGRLVRGADGPFVFELIDAGITPNGQYALLSFDAMTGFAASDFEVRGVPGSFAFANGTLGFTAAVPEPAALALWLMGLVAVRVAVARRAATARPAYRGSP